jgi:hypothetical protein
VRLAVNGFIRDGPLLLGASSGDSGDRRVTRRRRRERRRRCRRRLKLPVAEKRFSCKNRLSLRMIDA